MRLFLLLVLVLNATAWPLEDQNTSMLEVQGFGVEINPISPFTAFNDATQFYSLGFSYFNKGSEIYIPIFYTYMTPSDQTSATKIKKGKDFNIDLRFRAYLWESPAVFFGSGFVGLVSRFAYLEGQDRKIPGRIDRLTRYGLGVEIGIRRMGVLGFENSYWGASVTAGYFFDDYGNMIESNYAVNNTEQLFFDLDIMKFGILF